MSRLGLYLRYATRSLRRGGQRTVLGVFCIAVGVMAVVALRLAGDMITASLTQNVREANGGDVSLVSTAVPLTQNDLSEFRSLQARGLIGTYLPIGLRQGTVRGSGRTYDLSSVYVLDDPSQYPLAGNSHLAAPSDATFGSALAPTDSLVVTQFVASQAGLHVGDHVHLTIVGGRSVEATLTGELGNTGLRNTGTTAAFISHATYAQLTSRPETYGLIEMTAPSDTAASRAASELRTAYPLASVQTVNEAIADNIQAAQQVTQYLEIIGLLALAIGGIGIVNTLQVMLSRRRVEIAMLKTAGFRRRDLYALFGIEVGILGLLGGVIGTAAGVGMSLVVKVLIEQVVSSTLTFTLSPASLLTGVAVGVVTSLVFGLLPVVRAAAVRPLAVLRDQTEERPRSSLVQSAGLYALVLVLFILLAGSILGNLGFALQIVLYALVGLVVIGAIFSLIVTLVARIPVPERFTRGYVAGVVAAVVVAALTTIALRGIGAALLVLSLLAILVVLLPRSQRTVVKLALRAVGRARGRTAGTLVALFVGVFTIGLVLIVGQDISSELNSAFNNLATYNVFVVASPQDAQQTRAVTQSLPGLMGRRVTEDLDVSPTALRGQPVASLLGAPTSSRGRRRFELAELAGMEGYDLASGETPGAPPLEGRALQRSDAGTDNVIVPASLRSSKLHVGVGDVITVMNPRTHAALDLKIVGFYSEATRSSGGGLKINFFFQPILADAGTVSRFGSADASTIVALKLDPSQKLQALQRINDALPNASVLDLADLSALVQQILGNLVDLLIGIASLALFAGAVIIANTVALAMLERRREIGILKSTGYTSRSMLAQVLIENGVVGAIGAIAGMLMVTLATVLLGAFTLKTNLAVGTPTVLIVMAGVVLLTMVVAGLVAWGPSRVRPLEVLRYE